MVLSTEEERALCKALQGEGVSNAELETLNDLARVLAERRREREAHEDRYVRVRGK